MGRLPVQDIVVADRRTWGDATKTFDNGVTPVLMYVQAPRRSGAARRRKSTWYIWHLPSRNLAYRNKGPQDVYWLSMGGTPDQQKRYYDVFIRPPLTASESTWLSRHGYVQVGQR